MEISIAPMLDLTNMYFRIFFRQISRNTLLFTEMIPLNAILLADENRFLKIEKEEEPIALQIGGSNPQNLKEAVKKANRYNYTEINLNAGCPSERVAKFGDFGASLMKNKGLTSDCLKAMLDNTDKTVSLKTRIALDSGGYDEMRDFIGACMEVGCKKFIIHARNARLNLSPKANRSEKMILRYDMVHRLKKELPNLTISINGDIKTNEGIKEHEGLVDGVMIGRAAYYNPFFLNDTGITRKQVILNMLDYVEQNDIKPHHVFRHMIGLFHECSGAKTFKKIISENTRSDIKQLKEAFKDFLNQL
ncbi:MAG: putative tRNA-dihydrouridine synthase [Alphaproteobacteria bacterium ADurb.Bin438]|nr:MAG: putative tRNA-dihydrouridine synthase [Alphaproteobacteria bacterium ADurb.Bin438]